MSGEICGTPNQSCKTLSTVVIAGHFQKRSDQGGCSNQEGVCLFVLFSIYFEWACQDF